MARSRGRLAERTALRTWALPVLRSELSTLEGPRRARRRDLALFREVAAACAAQDISGLGAWGQTHRSGREQAKANSENVTFVRSR